MPAILRWWAGGNATRARGRRPGDSSGYGNDGTLNGDPQWGVGRFGGALEFDGANDYVDCGSDPSLDLTVWTIAFWLNAAENKNYNGFVIKGLDAAENYEVPGIRRRQLPSSDHNEQRHKNIREHAHRSDRRGEWSHFAYNYDSTDGRQVYKERHLGLR